MRPEDAPVVVALVDDDVLEACPERRPPAVPRQHRAVEHVGVGEDVLAEVPRPVPLLAAAVPVVGGHPDVEAEGLERGELVLGERLGRREVEHARAALGPGAAPGPDRRERGQLVGQRLARRGPGGQHDVPAGVRRVGGHRLVPPRRRDPPGGERGDDVRRGPPGPRLDVRRPGRQQLEVAQPVGPSGHPGQPLDRAGDPGRPGRTRRHGAGAPDVEGPGGRVHRTSVAKRTDGGGYRRSVRGFLRDRRGHGLITPGSIRG